MTETIPYWKSNRFLKVFVHHKGEEGCIVCPDENIKLSMDRAPPPMRDPPSETKLQKLDVASKKKEKPDLLMNVLDGALKTVETSPCFPAFMKKRNRRIILITGIGCVALAIIICEFVYFPSVRMRSYAHVWDAQLSTADGGRYTARYSYVSDDMTLLRLYSSSDQILLAERMYYNPLPIRLIWSKGQLMYSTNENSFLYDGTIDLPPNNFDLLMSRLP